MNSFDIIIVGGGLVGAGFAVALRESGLRIALVDARLPSANDPRLFALNHGSCLFLQTLGVWQVLEKYATPIHQVHVSKQRHFGAVRLRKEDANLTALGYVIPARYIEAALQEKLQSLPNCTLYQPATLKQLEQQEQQVGLTINTAAGEETLTAQWVIGADGADSTVREQAGIMVEETSCTQSALVTKTQLQRSHQHIAYERFTPNGAIAMLPLKDNECATIWTADSATISQLAQLPETEFLQHLQTEFGYRLGRLLSNSQRHVFPLRMLRANTMHTKRVFLLGNSAHTLHPIAAQGFNLALHEVTTLVDNIFIKCKHREPLSMIVFEKTAEAIQAQQTASMELSKRLPSIFNSQSQLISIALPFGMLGLDLLPTLKRQFIKRFAS